MNFFKKEGKERGVGGGKMEEGREGGERGRETSEEIIKTKLPNLKR